MSMLPWENDLRYDGPRPPGESAGNDDDVNAGNAKGFWRAGFVAGKVHSRQDFRTNFNAPSSHLARHS